ncbi:hypothetical protein NM688_g4576 [Phlebia brevispora]|uniref:Uncharacterized protein n=1 Tax=Phlebia brevispora TaxID=194682 RepID=A0ACC1T287_9APHY|nr:hypothetical protein NM688_g4576 [Phlebia brevispora]
MHKVSTQDTYAGLVQIVSEACDEGVNAGGVANVLFALFVFALMYLILHCYIYIRRAAFIIVPDMEIDLVHLPRAREPLSGGGSMGSFSVRFLRQFPLVAGTLEGLYDGDVLVYDGERLVMEVREVDREHVALQVPVAQLCGNLNRASLGTLCYRHKILTAVSQRVVAELRTAVQDHVCGEQCGHYAVMFRRPVLSMVNPFHLAEPSVTNLGRNDSDAEFPPKPHSRHALAEFVKEWCTEISADVLGEAVCAVCGQLTIEQQQKKIAVDNPLLKLLCIEGVVASAVSDDRMAPVLCPAGICDNGAQCSVCGVCMKALRRRTVPNIALANGLWVGEVPECLARLNFVEKLVVARYRHNACIVKVHKGGYKMSANAIVFPQPVAKLNAVLPVPKEDLDEMLAILFTGPTAPLESDFKRTPFINLADALQKATEGYRSLHLAARQPTDEYDKIIQKWQFIACARTMQHTQGLNTTHLEYPVDPAHLRLQPHYPLTPRIHEDKVYKGTHQREEKGSRVIASELSDFDFLRLSFHEFTAWALFQP